MPSPAQLHMMRALAARSVAVATAGPPEGSPEGRMQALLLAQLDTDRRQLKDIKSKERKADAKRTMLPTYVPHIEGVLAADAGGDDPIVGFVLAWRVDVGDYEGALQLGAYVLKHSLSMPDNWQRTPAEYMAEQFAEQAFRERKADRDFNVEHLVAVDRLTEGYDMHDQVRAKLLLALGREVARGEPEAALVILKRAVELHKDVGAKKDIERLEAVVKRSTLSSATAES